MNEIIHSNGCVYHLAKPIEYQCNCKPYLFYYEEAESAWVLCPERLEHIISVENLSDGDNESIEFKRIRMTDKEIQEIPEQ